MEDDTTNCLYDEYKSLEQSWMVLKDQYSEVVRALGFEGDSLWGDPFVSHSDVLTRAKACNAAHEGLHKRSSMDPW